MQEVIKIEGGHTLEGEVTISSAKNATVALIPLPYWPMDQSQLLGYRRLRTLNPSQRF